MSLFRPTGSQWRAPSLGRNLVADTFRGRLRIRKWPRPAGQPRHPRQRANLRYFALLQRAFKALTAGEILTIREALERHNRRNRGQRGSAAIRLRDWEHQRLSGRAWLIWLADGRKFYPHAVQRDASDILDHLWIEGEIFPARKADRWECIKAGPPGSILTAGPPGSPPSFVSYN